MTKENIQEFAVALNSSPSEGAGEGTEAKRNKKTQLLSALLSASALGVFLEGCGGGGGTPAPVTPDPVTPLPPSPLPLPLRYWVARAARIWRPPMPTPSAAQEAVIG